MPSEQDFKYLIAAYQSKSTELFNQSIGSDAKVRQLTDIIEQLSQKINEQQEEIEKLSKTKTTHTTKSSKDTGTF